MLQGWKSHLDRWVDAGLVDPATAERIRGWESGQVRPQGLRWPALLALAFGGILLGAGVLLFVAANWNQLSRAGQTALVVALVAAFHVSGVLTAKRLAPLSMILHAIGTVALGAGIIQIAQIYHLHLHWSRIALLWTLGASIAWALLRQWPQGLMVAMLVPMWLSGEWDAWLLPNHSATPMFATWCALSFAYLSAYRGPEDSALRKALGWLGGIALMPSAAAVTVARAWSPFARWQDGVVALVIVAGSLGVALALRRRGIAWNVGATAWTLLLVLIADEPGGAAVHGWCALGAVGLAAWGIREGRAERINLGVAGFALTVIAFYFSSVMDKLDRSVSLIGLGLLFLGGGWLLERTRRRLVAQAAS